MKTFYLNTIVVLFLISGCFAACDKKSPEDRFFHCTMIRECYYCGIKNKFIRGLINVSLQTGGVIIAVDI